MKTPRDLQMLFASVAHLDEGLSLETLFTLKVGKVPHLLSGYTEAISIHNRSGVNFILENVNKK
jgi:hypothetical protein